jgi:hypothetical protein
MCESTHDCYIHANVIGIPEWLFFHKYVLLLPILLCKVACEKFCWIFMWFSNKSPFKR